MRHHLASAILATLVACGPATPNQGTAPAEPERSDTSAPAGDVQTNGDVQDDGQAQHDSDEDGVVDAKDACPVESGRLPDGKVSANGCPDPDADRDEIADAKDDCKDEAETRNGYRDADGCPDEIPEEVVRFSGTIEGIRFRSGAAVLAPSSYKALDEAVITLSKYPKLRFEIQGHTDSAGDPEKNRALSQSRAETVRNYLIDKGIAADRLVAKGYGADQPIASNATKAGRAKNRRVEFKLLTAE